MKMVISNTLMARALIATLQACSKEETLEKTTSA
ncbi:MAG: hypothetical protein JWQ28_1824, partial [Pedobacter sp.]|nr:hypothetical protein [Pedobacter sp.]